MFINYGGEDYAANLFRKEMQNYGEHFLIIKQNLLSYENTMMFVSEIRKVTR